MFAVIYGAVEQFKTVTTVLLSNLPISLALNGYGPISDNAGGISEMAELGPEVPRRTDSLDAAGNTTAAIGKGFAFSSLVSLSRIPAQLWTDNLADTNQFDRPYAIRYAFDWRHASLCLLSSNYEVSWQSCTENGR